MTARVQSSEQDLPISSQAQKPVSSVVETNKQKQPMFRINVNLSKTTYETLKKLADESELDMSQFVRNALQVYNYLLNQQNANKKIYIGSDNVIETELLVPGSKLR